METPTPPGIRDANFKRDLGIRQTSGVLVSLIDSDMVIPSDWMSNAVRLLMENEVDCVAGVMRSIHDDFWGRFVDGNRLGAKTPRAKAAYLVTAEGFGAAGYKPPITADILFTRKMYEDCPIDGNWSHGSLEDYEWFWRVVERGHRVLVSNQLFGWHHHRSGLKKLIGEYRRSARGCAYFIRAHRESPFAQKRMTQAIALPLALFGILLGLAGSAYMGHGGPGVAAGLALVLGGIAFLSGREFVRTRSPESLLYPIPALILGINYTASLVTHLIRSAPMRAAAPTAYDVPVLKTDALAGDRGPKRLLHPLTFILTLQACLSLSLVWSNTAFGDEADYLWLGRLLIAHWLHGTSWPSQYADTVLSGSPLIFPPLGAIANAIGGLAGARILSLIFMLGATALLYSVAHSLFDRWVALCSAVIWVVSEPTIKLAFATYDPLSVFFIALTAWLIVQVAARKYRGEFILLAALSLGLANATTYSAVVIDPVVFVFAFLVWRMRIGRRGAWLFLPWMLVAAAMAFAVVMTVGHSWAGIMTTVVSRSLADKQAMLLVLGDVWAYSGFALVLGIVGIVLAYGERRAVSRRFALVVLLGLSSLVVPLAQLHEQTATSLDKHLAFGLWFASMSAGYAAAVGIRAISSRTTRVTSVAACAVAVFYPANMAWQSAWLNFHGWANSSSFVTAISPVLAGTRGDFYTTGGVHIAEYYTPQGRQWDRWSDIGIPMLTTAGVPSATWNKDLRSSDYGAFALFYPTSFSAPSISGSLLLSTNPSSTSSALLKLAGANASEPGLPELTKALESDQSYRLVSVGPYNSRSLNAIYAIWEKV